VSREFRLTSTTWARVIKDQLYVLDYEGIARFNPLRAKHRQITLSQILIHDEAYMDRLCESEVAYLMSDTDYQEDWEEHVEWHVHRKGCCPHEDAEDYEAAYQKMLADDCAREEFFRERVEWQWLRDTVTEWADNDLERIAAFVREHPVTAVWEQRNEEWINIDDVLAFCPDCGEPVSRYEGELSPFVEPHEFQRHHALYSPGPCAICDSHDALGEHMACFYDKDENMRPLLCCPDCSFRFTTDDLDGSFVENFGRPATWPRDAPYPPRRGFLGEPMDVVPWED